MIMIHFTSTNIGLNQPQCEQKLSVMVVGANAGDGVVTPVGSIALQLWVPMWEMEVVTVVGANVRDKAVCCVSGEIVGLVGKDSV